MEKLTKVRLIRHHAGCNPGEIAGFSAATAEELVARGHAELVEEAKPAAPTAPETEALAPSGDRSGADSAVTKKGRK